MDDRCEGLPLQGAAEVSPEILLGVLTALIKGRTKEALAHAESWLADPVWREAGELLKSLCEQVEDMNRYALELAQGNLRAQSAGPNNRIANGLKALQNALLHMIWQAKQVTEGDYSQRVEYLGELSDVFNVMIEQLAERELALREEIEKHREMEESLKQSYELLLSASDAAGQSVYFVDSATGEVTFLSENAKQAERECMMIGGKSYKIVEQITASGIREGQQEIQCMNCGRWLSVASRPGFQMNGQSIDVHITHDITDRKNNEMKLIDQAQNDPLTGLLNRRAGRELIMELIRTDQVFVVVFVDIDDFKHINDNYGHAQGDYVLKSFSDMARTVLRHEDVIFRYAGDEFIVILPNCSKYKAADVMNRIREKLLARDDVYGINFSCGYSEHMQGDVKSVDGLVDEADREMYLDKAIQKKTDAVDKEE